MKSKPNSLKIILLRIYSLWAFFWFVSIYLLLFPGVFFLFHSKKTKAWAGNLIKLWAYLFFPLSFIRINVKFLYKPDWNKNYVFCANHFSYLDIPVFYYILKNNFSFIGKASIKKIPLIGIMYSKLHILVDRESKTSRGQSITRGVKALLDNRSLVIFPEGGIRSKNFPRMEKNLKEGAFQMAAKTNREIIPVSLLNNYQMMDDEKFILKPGRIDIIFHAPIVCMNRDISEAKEEFYSVVQESLNQYHQINE